MKIDNIFKRTVSDKIFTEQYEVPFGRYSNIAEGMKSNDSHVKMLAVVLKTIDIEVEKKKSEMRIKNQDSPVAFSETELSSLYKKILKQMQTEFITL